MTSSIANSALLRTARAGLLAGVAMLTSCEVFTPPPPMPPSPFTPEGRPRYGYNGAQSPSYPDAPAALPGEKPRVPTTSNKPPRIVRDPNNTTVNIDPPKPREPKPETPADLSPPVTPTVDTPPSIPSTPETPPAKPSAREDLPYGTPVVGKKGFVYSPYAEDKGYVDVDGLKRGTRVKCPYTSKHFRVP